jgi:transcriptional regulator with XRE-family HTH domain
VGWDEIKTRRGDPRDTREYKDERRALQVAQAIRSIRHRAGLSQNQLAVRMGTTQPTVARWEAGACVPTLGTIRRLAESTGQRATLVFTEEGATDVVNANATIEIESLRV